MANTYKIYGYNEVHVNEEGKVTHAVVYDDMGGAVALYPYKNGWYGGLDNCSGEYTVAEFRRKVANGTGCFR